jgi:hypothetical protein
MERMLEGMLELSPSGHEDLAMTIVDISGSNPFRPPDLRWKRALCLYDGQANPHSRRDDR